MNLESLSILAGANNAGKSNLVDAIRIFYGDLKWSSTRDLPKISTLDAASWIEIEYAPDEIELENLKDEYKSARNTFRVRFYPFSQIDENGQRREGLYGYEQNRLSEEPFYGAKNVGLGKIGRIIYIPAVSKIDDTTKLTGPSILRDIISEILSKVVEKSPSYQELSKAFDMFDASIKSETNSNGKSLAALESEVTKDLETWGATFSLNINSIQPEDIIKSLIKPSLIDLAHGESLDATQFGAGFQRHLIYSLIKLAAKYSELPQLAANSKKEFLPNLTWILFEEPEAFLHPPQEEEMYDNLRKLVLDESVQVLATTHSSRFVGRSMDDLRRLVRIRRDSGYSKTFQLSQIGIDNFFEETLERDSLFMEALGEADPNKNALMAALKTEIWIQATRATAFFSERVILVEGASEQCLYEYLLTRKLMAPPIRGLSVIDCLGKYNIHRFVSLLSAFGVDHSVLYDGDRGKANDAEVLATIQNARSTFTKKVIRLDGAIEEELGIEPLSRQFSRNKPQYLLYQLENNNIPNERISNLISLFQVLALEEDELLQDSNP